MKALDKFDPQIAAIAKPDPSHNPLVILGQQMRSFAKDAIALKKQEISLAAAMRSAHGGSGRKTTRRRGARRRGGATASATPTGSTYQSAVARPRFDPFVPTRSLYQVKDFSGRTIDLVAADK